MIRNPVLPLIESKIKTSKSPDPRSTALFNLQPPMMFGSDEEGSRLGRNYMSFSQPKFIDSIFSKDEGI